MSRAGCPYDNAPMESYYATFKAELIEQQAFENNRQLDSAVAEYVMSAQQVANFSQSLFRINISIFSCCLNLENNIIKN